MIKYIAALLLLTSCARDPSDVGRIVRYTEWECVKSDLNPGFSFNGDFVVTSSCSVSKCFESEYVLGETIFSKKLIVRRLVADEYCLDK